jgi:hypothetical protein
MVEAAQRDLRKIQFTGSRVGLAEEPEGIGGLSGLKISANGARGSIHSDQSELNNPDTWLG